MKKITLLFAALLLVAIGAKAQTINNPKDANGYFIVKWDCSANNGQGGWAASNDFEVDEAFTFAIDITHTAFEDWLKTPTNPGGTRSIAVNKWSGFGDFNGDTHRLRQIQGNIYGATWCFTQMANTFDVGLATVPDSVTYFNMQVFGFEYTADNAGALWWQWPAGWLAEGTTIDAVDGVAFTSAPYTGTKTSVEFYCDDYDGFWGYTAGGYAPSCAVIDRVDTGNTGIPAVKADSSPVVSHEYYNLLGVKLVKEPVSGLFIDKALKADGTTIATKVLKPLK